MAITKNIVEAMGGEITLESTVGCGSNIIVNIKEVEVATVSELDMNKDDIFDYKAISFAPATVLIVDDIDDNRELLKTYLEDYGLELFEASNGKETIESVRKHQPDLILLDIRMPKMDGFEVSDVLKNDEHIKDIPLVAVTASTLKYDREQLFKICDEFLSKPVKREELLRIIMKFLPHTVKEIKNLQQPKKLNSDGNAEIKQ